MKLRIPVLTTNPSLGILTYTLPVGKDIVPGSIVRIPLGPRQISGMVWDTLPLKNDIIPESRLRSISEIYDLPPAKRSYRRLISWVAAYYMASESAILRMGLPLPPPLMNTKITHEYYPTGNIPTRLTVLRKQALERLSGKKGQINELATFAHVSVAVIRGLIKEGALAALEVKADEIIAIPDPNFKLPVLSRQQQEAADQLRSAVEESKFRPFLLDGVTGSGKTEVYFEAVAQAIKDQKQALILLPEIALTEPFLTRFSSRFGCKPVAWHSDLSQSRRRQAWRAIVSGKAKVVIGARSALFLPFKNMGLIIVDEAHETSFKQEDGVCYQARDVAVMRAKFEEIPAILASATPALETVLQVKLGHYKEIKLPKRHGSAGLPNIHAINLLEHPLPRGRWLAEPLVKSLKEALVRHEQGLLFLNRRGYAPLTLCRHCGYRIQCPHCTAWMVEHRQQGQMICHHCGFTTTIPDHCPECHEKDALVACGPGVERITEEASILFPEARIATVTSDTLTTPIQAAAFIDQMEQGAIDIIVGTQLVTKGYHFPRLTVVGVVDADLGLQGGDLRASEHSFQQIAQVAGRAGRSDLMGHVFIQTYEPDVPVIQALISGNREQFYQAEMDVREITEAPPFGRYVALIISSEKQDVAEAIAHRLGHTAPIRTDMEIFGPAPAPMMQLRGRYRYRLLVQAKRTVAVQKIIRKWLSTVDIPSSIRITIDVDPYNFF
ncbi:MAG: primosomal protein N' [Zymomonas mobilis subsp. pomaceae]|uniref:Replication restart protein PriA n=1 Tax=Zymomonas mobilis subsp. pomaceae (strain ATCC 29192 / DSM 22645 / JCM 10191 / CCUG 17912 / NBRC 13757 / NCIMB 11200 / NRRL B-4491 / Barker I) TaxID=579138 RepID=F8ETZ7_ZYMMT|nr:primosomal protein N' [Zymomonas mobilis]AEI38094.1 primosomal protein N' [Zymomonas mobilis subsp. pomaceae ATCC 29192]MDX5949460.1 primosomal protein N' [Zymomonas mobilis subsp. pomaceae]GEB89203.1 primosomal protein N' [Zymomonas mobilis subsp. pomaceae]